MKGEENPSWSEFDSTQPPELGQPDFSQYIFIAIREVIEPAEPGSSP
jgi:hypothetical protein